MNELGIAVQVACNLQATLVNSKSNDEQFRLWTAGMAKYLSLVLQLTVSGNSHPEWSQEIDGLLAPAGCPAQKVSLMETFLKEKGVRLYEGVPLDFS